MVGAWSDVPEPEPGGVERRRAVGLAAVALVLVASAIVAAATGALDTSSQPRPARVPARTVRTAGSASTVSFARARSSCDAEVPRLQRSTAHRVRLVAAYPTDAYYAWTWVQSDSRVDTPSDRVSAKVCLYAGRFTEFASSPPSAVVSGSVTLPRTVPLYAQVQEPNGQDLGVMLAEWPHGTLHLEDLRADGGLAVVHWAPW